MFYHVSNDFWGYFLTSEIFRGSALIFYSSQNIWKDFSNNEETTWSLKMLCQVPHSAICLAVLLALDSWKGTIGDNYGLLVRDRHMKDCLLSSQITRASAGTSLLGKGDFGPSTQREKGCLFSCDVIYQLFTILLVPGFYFLFMRHPLGQTICISKQS